MAMAFAPLALKTPIHIENADVVSKSYPDFWQDLKKIGFEISEMYCALFDKKRCDELSMLRKQK
jgi:hypothetical protein